MSLLKWAGAGVVLVGLLVLGVAVRNKYFKQREIVIGSGLNRAAVYVPTDLVYSPTSQGTKVEMYSPDRTLNQYYYQTGGVQLWLAWNNPRTANIADIPMALASKTEVQAKMGQATIYIYPGADGDGHGRGQMGSVHQGEISVGTSSLGFYCYDHSSGGVVSPRCTEIINMVVKTIRAGWRSYLPF